MTSLAWARGYLAVLLPSVGSSLDLHFDHVDSFHTVMTGFVAMFLPFSRTMDLVIAIGACLLSSGYIVYDTYTINRRLSPDEYIMGAISLYLEYVPSDSVR